MLLRRAAELAPGERGVEAAALDQLVKLPFNEIGLLPVVPPRDEVRALTQAGEAEIDLEAQAALRAAAPSCSSSTTTLGALTSICGVNAPGTGDAAGAV